MKEGNIGKLILLETAKIGARLFRNNIGTGIIGQIEMITGPRRRFTVELGAGDAIVRNARIFHAGFPEGSHDYIGFSPVVITVEMVGKTLPVFTSIEAKTATGRVRTKQASWLQFMLSAGAISGVARSPEDAVSIVRKGPSI